MHNKIIYLGKSENSHSKGIGLVRLKCVKHQYEWEAIELIYSKGGIIGCPICRKNIPRRPVVIMITEEYEHERDKKR